VGLGAGVKGRQAKFGEGIVVGCRETDSDREVMVAFKAISAREFQFKPAMQPIPGHHVTVKGAQSTSGRGQVAIAFIFRTEAPTTVGDAKLSDKPVNAGQQALNRTAKHNIALTPAQAALRFALGNKDLATRVLGITTVGQLDEALEAAARGPLPTTAIAKLDALWANEFEPVSYTQMKLPTIYSV